MGGIRSLPAATLLALASGCATTSPSDRWRDGALGIAKWLDHVAVPTEHGLRWPRAPEAAPQFDEEGKAVIEPVDPALYAGSAGVVLFFLELHAAARDDATASHALAQARAGADELIATLPKKCGGEGCGLYTGIAGIGFTLEEVARATGEPKYRDGAQRCVKLLQESAKLAGTGIEWGDSTDVISGSAGIGCFLLYMHEREREEPLRNIALDLATRAGRRLLDLSRREEVGRSWRMDPNFPRVMPNFSHGTAGVAYFLARLHGVTGLPEFQDAARDGADHLLSIADRIDGGCRIYHHAPDGTDLYYLGWCHGPCGTARLFAELARQTGDPRYADAVRGGARSVRTSGLPAQRLPGFWNNVGVCCGSAGVIDFLLTDAAAAHDDDELRFAESVADDLLARATRDEHGIRFVQAEHRVKPELLEAQTGLMQGAAGVGIALLHLVAATRHDVAPIMLPDAPCPIGRLSPDPR